MDLDNIKKAWNENTFTSCLTEKRILDIISRKGKTSLDRLLWFEIIGLLIVLPCMSIPYIHELYFPRVPYPEFTKLFFVTMCATSFFWQIYKVRLLRSIDLKADDIITSLNTISKYKLYIKREFFIAVPFITAFIISFCYGYVDVISKEAEAKYYLINFTILIIAIILMILFYKLFYKKNISSMEIAFKEVKEMRE